MEWLLDNWFLLAASVAVIVLAVMHIRQYFGLPKETQLEKVREWLLFAVTMAEKEYGSGTGKIKLRYVYDMFLEKFGWMARVITFEMFSALVDKALEEMRPLLEQNEKVASIVNGDT